MNPKKLTKGKIISPPKSFKAKMKNQEHKSLLFCENAHLFLSKIWRHLIKLIFLMFKTKFEKTICPAC